MHSLWQTVALNGVAFFQAQDSLTTEDLAELALALGTAAGKPETSTLHIHPTQELGENGLPIGTISNVADKDGRQISFMEERSTIASSNWHTDVSFVRASIIDHLLHRPLFELCLLTFANLYLTNRNLRPLCSLYLRWFVIFILLFQTVPT